MSWTALRARLGRRRSQTVTALGALAALAALGMAGCGGARGIDAADRSSQAMALHGTPQVVEPVAGASLGANGGGAANGASGAGAGAGAGEVSVTPSPTSTGAHPVSNAQIDQELAASGINPNPDQATLTPSGLAIAPANAPAPVVEAIQAANQIAHLPYIWGGGHGEYVDTGYDCSGSLSFILAAAGLLNGTETSGELESYGAAGPGRWITIFATAGHTFAYIAGLRFDTVALAETGTRWSNRAADEPDLASFVVRHPVGL